MTNNSNDLPDTLIKDLPGYNKLIEGIEELLAMVRASEFQGYNVYTHILKLGRLQREIEDAGNGLMVEKKNNGH